MTLRDHDISLTSHRPFPAAGSSTHVPAIFSSLHHSLSRPQAALQKPHHHPGHPVQKPPQLQQLIKMDNNGSSNGSIRPHVAILATRGMWHLIPTGGAGQAPGVAARRHDHAHHLRVHSVGHAACVFLASLPPAVSSLSRPPVDLSDLPCGTAIETLIGSCL